VVPGRWQPGGLTSGGHWPGYGTWWRQVRGAVHRAADLVSAAPPRLDLSAGATPAL